MFLNNLKVTLRHLYRNKIYSGISILGLAFGISCCALIALYVFDELSYDKFHEKSDRIYRLSETIDHNGVIRAAATSFPVGPAMLEDYPEVETFSRVMLMGNRLTVKTEDNVFFEENFVRADSTLFDIFSIPFLSGNPKTALTAPRSIVLSDELAIKYFGSIEKAMNQTLRVSLHDYNITGVFEKLPHNTDIRFEAAISMTSIPEQAQTTINSDWFRINCFTFLLLKSPVNIEEFNTKLEQFTEVHIKPFVATFGEGSTATFDIVNIEDVHFDTSRDYDSPKGNLTYIYLFSVIGIFILIIACINFINLSLSQSIKRAKEVGIRKSVGAENVDIRKQFLGETLIIAILSMLIGLSLVEILLPAFNQLTSKEVSFNSIVQFDMLLTLLGIILTIGILAGSYPALVLSKFDPVNIIRGTLPGIGNFTLLRKGLVLLQFLFSLFMILGTLAVFNQMSYLRDKDLGFDKEAVALIRLPQDTAVFNKIDYFKSELLTYPSILNVSSSASMPGASTGEIMFRVEQEGQLIDKSIKIMAIDDQFLDLMKIDLEMGRNFSKEIQTDRTQGFIINKTAAEKFGWKEDPLGKRMQWGLLPNNQAQYDGKVIGVVDDFHFMPLHNPIEPLAMIFRPTSNALLSVKMKPEELKSSLEIIESKWKEFAGIYPIDYLFLDDRINNQYQSEEIMLKVFTYFSLISLLIASLGLFAITSYTVEQKVKEIGIRKILGASNQHLSWLISKEIIAIVMIAFLIISPISWIVIDHWLESFSYKDHLPIFSYILTGIGAIFISFLTISYHIIKVSKNDPVKALRYE